ncbi:MAG: hypothetical protein SFY95_08895 [Planctomycetota bacterium]|nr:hypothetical protein [Planctomycetota bacterium]
MNASYQEKSVWVQLASLLVGLGAYFVFAGRLLLAGEREMSAFAGLSIAAVVAMVVLLVVGHALAAIGPRPEPSDERDRVISWRSEYRSSWINVAGVLGAVTAMALGVESVWTANVLLLALALAEVVGLVLRLVAYRWGG